MDEVVGNCGEPEDHSQEQDHEIDQVHHHQFDNFDQEAVSVGQFQISQEFDPHQQLEGDAHYLELIIVIKIMR